jgi:hypothetical protein
MRPYLKNKLKPENRKVKRVLSGGWHQWEEGGYKERV